MIEATDVDDSAISSFEIEEKLKGIYKEYVVSSFPQEPNVIQPNCDFAILSTIRYDPDISDVPPVKYEEITRQNFFLLPEHVKRLRFTFEFFHYLCETVLDFEITEEDLLKQLIACLKSSDALILAPHKIRGLFQLDGSVKLEIHNTPIRKNLLGVLCPKVEDMEKFHFLHNFGRRNDNENEEEEGKSDNIWDVYTNNESCLISPFTSFKTTSRDVYNRARKVLPGLKPGREEVLLFNTQNHLMEGSISNVAVKLEEDGKWVTPMLSSGCLCGYEEKLFK
ncbi:ABZ2 [Candida oxycetoniae]|uniref:ABZ2 n=1 Tax=Candida oxycetoniae TaxID=497107 RepID=A0AAI9SX49_9ASCO|nr:ABZ2 [Candida oxycetoniae]KAI3404384.2 ABZ2 [Candida oxycetoniae]